MKNYDQTLETDGKIVTMFEGNLDIQRILGKFKSRLNSKFHIFIFFLIHNIFLGKFNLKIKKFFILRQI